MVVNVKEMKTRLCQPYMTSIHFIKKLKFIITLQKLKQYILHKLVYNICYMSNIQKDMVIQGYVQVFSRKEI